MQLLILDIVVFQLFCTHPSVLQLRCYAMLRFQALLILDIANFRHSQYWKQLYSFSVVDLRTAQNCSWERFLSRNMPLGARRHKLCKDGQFWLVFCN